MFICPDSVAICEVHRIWECCWAPGRPRPHGWRSDRRRVLWGWRHWYRGVQGSKTQVWTHLCASLFQVFPLLSLILAQVPFCSHTFSASFLTHSIIFLHSGQLPGTIFVRIKVTCFQWMIASFTPHKLQFQLGTWCQSRRAVFPANCNRKLH